MNYDHSFWNLNHNVPPCTPLFPKGFLFYNLGKFAFLFWKKKKNLDHFWILLCKDVRQWIFMKIQKAHVHAKFHKYKKWKHEGWINLQNVSMNLALCYTSINMTLKACHQEERIVKVFRNKNDAQSNHGLI